jgi:hypothetical protein
MRCAICDVLYAIGGARRAIAPGWTSTAMQNPNTVLPSTIFSPVVDSKKISNKPLKKYFC